MIITGNLSNIPKVDEYYAIVRSTKSNPLPSYILQIDKLSPSKELLFTYLKLRKDNNWNEFTFRSIYYPKFINQIYNDPDALQILNNLKSRDSEGLSVALLCYCHNYKLCHRSIIGNILITMGCNVLIR